MSRIFLSHSSSDDHAALALREWLGEEGWSADSDVYLDIHPDSGMAAGQRWLSALEEAATRCEAVVFLISDAWLKSQWCSDEMRLAETLHKRIFTLLIEDIDFSRLPHGLTAEWQVVHLHTGVMAEEARRFRTNHPITNDPGTSNFSVDGLKRLKNGLKIAGIGADSFELQPDPNGPFGWRMPYRGLEPLQAADAAVFFGRDADIVRGIDTLRGLASRKSPRMLVVLGSSGSGKSSYLRAGLLPRLQRDDVAWIPFPPIRVADHGAFEGSEGLISALEVVFKRFDVPVNRSDLRHATGSPKQFIGELKKLREMAARRALIDDPDKAPLPLISIDQAEELSLADANPDATQLLELVRAAMDSGNLMLLTTIRSDSYDALQGLPALSGVHQSTLSLAPIAPGEIARIIRGPAKVLQAKVGSEASSFSAEVVEALQREMGSETDALPLLAFALQRLIREHQATRIIGLPQLEATGGVEQAISAAANESLSKAGVSADPQARRQLLREIFVPRLALIDPVTHKPQRRVAGQDLFEEPELQAALNALQEYRLLVSKGTKRPTLEVAHEALLRHWPELHDILVEDREFLLKLDVVQRAAKAWLGAPEASRKEYLVHRGRRLSEAVALLDRPDFARELNGAGKDYLVACTSRESDLLAKEARQTRTKRILSISVISLVVIAAVITAIAAKRVAGQQRNLAGQASRLIGVEARKEYDNAHYDRAMRIALLGIDSRFDLTDPLTRWTLARSAFSSRLIADLRAHDDQVNQASFSPSGDRLVTASDDGTARVWSSDADGQWTSTVLGDHTEAVNDAVFSPDGELIVTVSDDHAVRVWSSDVNQQWSSASLSGHTEAVSSVSFSRTGNRMVTSSRDKTARVWTPTGTGQWTSVPLQGHEGRILSVAFSPGGERLLTTSDDRTARVWFLLDDGSWSSQELSGDRSSINDGVFAPSGDRLATVSGDGSTRIWNLYDDGTWMAEVLPAHAMPVLHVTFSPDGRQLVTSSWDKTARVWSEDASGEWKFQSLGGHRGPVTQSVFSPRGDRLVTVSGDETARIWVADRQGNWLQERLIEAHTGAINHVEFSAAGDRLVTASADHSVRIWRAENAGLSASQALEGHAQLVNYATFSPTGNQVVTASWDNTARLWEPDDFGEWKSTVLAGHGEPVTFAAFEPGGERVVTASWDGTARLWSQDDQGVWTDLVLTGHSDVINHVAFSPDGEWFVTSSDDQTARVWADNPDGEWSSQVLEGHVESVEQAAFSPDGEHLATSSPDGTVRMWTRGESGAWGTQSLEGHRNAVTHIEFSPDGAYLVSASNDRTARVWAQQEDGNWVSAMTLGGHSDAVNYAAFSPEDYWIVTASNDRTARLWQPDAEGRYFAEVLSGHTRSVEQARFSPDGKQVVTASGDGTVRLWVADSYGVWVPQVLEGHADRVIHVGYSEQGDRLVTASEDGTARIWDIDWLATPLSAKEFSTLVCRDKLLLEAHKVTAVDVINAPILRDFLDFDVCERFLK